MTACPVWDSAENTHAAGAEKIEGVYGEEDCQASCLEQADCVGFDLDSRDGDSCWLHLDEDNYESEKPWIGVTLYKLVSRCPAGKKLLLHKPKYILKLTTLNCIGIMKPSKNAYSVRQKE